MTVADGAVLACAGFLAAVLWMDLIFDTQVVGERGAELPEPILASIAGYYHRATTSSRPMGRLIALVMLILLGALAFQAVTGNEPGWLLVASAVLAVAPILVALRRTVPNAVRLGLRLDTPAEQSRLARAVLLDHLLCLPCILGLIALWLVRVASA